ncbi:MAG: PEP-CTERM sorting domain-containing protein [Candidatus Thiodiazotropha sp.]
MSFRFDLWTSGTGAHDYNQVQAWVDWNQDFAWANDSSEIVLQERVFRTPYSVVPASISILTSSSFLITEDMVGDLWLRARAQCNHVPFGSMTPYGELWQGEAEDWRLSVSTANVPEPASILLLGTGLLGLIGVRNRRA